MDPQGTWLCPTPADRERLLDMEPRIAKARTLAFSAAGLGLLTAAPWYGWWIALPLAWIVVSHFLLLGPLIERSRHPEWPIFATVVNAQATIGVAIALTGGPRSPAQPLLLFSVVSVAARFRGRGVLAAAGFTAVVLLASTIAVDPSRYADDPAFVDASFVCLIGLAACCFVLMGSDIRQRAEAILDPLTGLLNRKALTGRFAELVEQAALSGAPIALVLCDVDRFKAVNDEHGHERGDAVLKEVAYVMRRSLRSFELIYRLGGDEFLILLPGADLGAAHELAERVREALAGARPGGLAVTASIGVASTRGTVAFEDLFRAADGALYRAKHAGRDRVALAQPVDDAALALST
ncbi:MAG: GGDEF domain-containing protein [Actinobacteria bacterium]|nr:GGDEF domain-containing protein [Actinomycetota bacterium]